MEAATSYRKRIICLLLYIFAIFASIPFIWRVEVFLRAKHLLMVTVYLLIALFIAAMVLAILRSAIKLGVGSFAALAVYIALYGAVILTAKGFDKKVHFIEYGILAFLAHGTFKRRKVGAAVYLFSFTVVAFVGSLDELVQYYIPHRTFDIEDLLSNLLAGLLMFGFIFLTHFFCSQEKG